MASNGRINGTCTGISYTKYSTWVDWDINSQNSAGCSSNVTVTMKVQRNDGIKDSAYNLSKVNPVSLSVGGVVRVSDKIGIDTRNNQIVTLATWISDVAHDDSGELNLAISGSFSLSGTSVKSLTGGSVSGTAKLNPISRYPGAVTACTAAQGDDKVNYNRGTVTVAWSGASGVITGYKIERAVTGRNDSTYGVWALVKSVTSSATSGSITDTAPAAYMSGVKFKYRVTALNGTLASSAKESNALTVRGGFKVKINGAWCNGTVWVKVNGTWLRAKRITIKINGNWR